MLHSRDEITRSLSRPGDSEDRTRIGTDGATRLDARSLSRRSMSSSGDSTAGVTAADGSLPVSRPRSEVTRSLVRPGTSGEGVRAPLGETRKTRSDDLSRTTRAPLTRGPADVGIRSGGTDRVRSIDRSGLDVGRAGGDRMQVARTAASESLKTRTLAHGSVAGREVFVRSNDTVSRRDVRVLEVGHHESHGEHVADFVPHHGGWDPAHSEWHEHHDEWWHHHDHDHHHVDFDFSFTFVSSYFAPAGAVVYDVVPAYPVVVAPAPVFSASFAYYSAPAVVSVSSVRYVYPVAAVAPAVVVYHEYFAPPIITPIVFTPVVTTPVYAAPVVMPMYAPVYAPVYYYYPSYAVLSYPTYYVEPAPVVAAPAVVEAPGSGWSISTAFGFDHHGKSFSFGGSFTKVKSEPAVVAAPAVVAPVPGVTGVEVPAAVLDPAVDAAGHSGAPIGPAGSATGAGADASSGGVEASGSTTVQGRLPPRPRGSRWRRVWLRSAGETWSRPAGSCRR